MATASRASSAEHAVVRIVSSSTWGLVGSPLAGHTLTVTRIAFSPDDKLVLTVSRDRGWRLFVRGEDGYAAHAAEAKAHARMVLDAAWSRSGKVFVTGSRDKSIKIWSQGEEGGGAWTASAVIKLTEGVTAVALTTAQGQGDILAVGTETGCIEFFLLSHPAVEPTRLFGVPSADSHASAVNRLAWHPTLLRLSSASEDRSVRVYDITL